MICNEILNKLKIITEEEQKIINGDLSIDKSLYMENNKNIINSKKMLADGELIAVRPHTRFVHFPEHSHDYVEVVYMAKGKTLHIIDGEQIELKEGELLFLCQSAKQEILPAGENDIAVNFIILPEFFDSALEMMENREAPLFKFLLDCLQNSDSNIKFLHFKVSDILPVQNLVENLLWTLVYKSGGRGSVNRFTMGLLLLQLVTYSERLVSKRNEDSFVFKVLSYIEENYKTSSLAELSEIMHYDKSTLSRAIRNKTGKNFIELVQEKRLSKACFLLKNTTLSVDDVSEFVGYDNVSFFHRLFKKYYGISPRKYRIDFAKKDIF